MQSVVGAVRSAAAVPRRYPALVLLLDDVQWADRASLALTPREVEVLRHVARGATNKDIAEALHISVKTVNAHLTSILAKVDCRTRAAATAFAFQHGLV